MEDLPKVPTQRLEWDLNLRPSEYKAPNLRLSHHAPQSVAYLLRAHRGSIDDQTDTAVLEDAGLLEDDH